MGHTNDILASVPEDTSRLPKPLREALENLLKSKERTVKCSTEIKDRLRDEFPTVGKLLTRHELNGSMFEMKPAFKKWIVKEGDFEDVFVDDDTNHDVKKEDGTKKVAKK